MLVLNDDVVQALGLSSEIVEALEAEADQVVCVQTPARVVAVGIWYVDFSPVPDEVGRQRRRVGDRVVVEFDDHVADA